MSDHIDPNRITPPSVESSDGEPMYEKPANNELGTIGWEEFPQGFFSDPSEISPLPSAIPIVTPSGTLAILTSGGAMYEKSEVLAGFERASDYAQKQLAQIKAIIDAQLPPNFSYDDHDPSNLGAVLTIFSTSPALVDWLTWDEDLNDPAYNGDVEYQSMFGDADHEKLQKALTDWRVRNMTEQDPE